MDNNNMNNAGGAPEAQDNYQNNYQQPQYTQPPYQQQQYQQQNLEEPVGMGEWLICMLLMMIPCLNIVLMCVWAFSKKEKKSKSNYFKAALIMFAIMAVLYIVMIAVFGASLVAAFN